MADKFLMKSTLLGLCLLLPLTLSCTKKSSDHAQVKIQFDSAIFGQSKKHATKSVVAANAPDWGVSDPTALSEVQCWGVFVGGPEPDMQASRCKNPNGDVIARFGPRAGFYPIDEAGVVSVPKGKDRRFYLAAMASADGTCHLGFDTNADLEFTNFSPPYIIATTKTDVLENKKNVYLELKNIFTTQNKIEDCDFIKPGLPDPNLQVSLFQSHRNVWIAGNPIPRTVTFSHDLGTAYCSNDDVNFSECSTGTYTWAWADAANTHTIRIEDDNGYVLDSFSFTPSSEYPGVSPGTCGLTINSGESFSSIGSSLLGSGNIICVANGVNISESNTALGMGDGNYLIVPYGASATIENTSASNSTIILGSGDDNNHIYGLQVISASTASGTLDITDTMGTKLVDVEIINNNGGPALQLYSASANTNTEIFSSALRANGGTNGVGLKASSSTPSIQPSAFIDNSVLEGTGFGFQATQAASFDIENSHIEGLGTSSFTFGLRQTSSVKVSNSKIVDNNGWGAQLHCNFSSFPLDLEISGNTFVRNNVVGSTATGAALGFGDCGSGDGPVTINSSVNDNIFCAVNPAIATFGLIRQSNDALDPFSTFDPTAYTVETCPTGTL